MRGLSIRSSLLTNRGPSDAPGLSSTSRATDPERYAADNGPVNGSATAPTSKADDEPGICLDDVIDDIVKNLLARLIIFVVTRSVLWSVLYDDESASANYD